jgi:Kef-type K+ transport system membrane component KefB
MPLPEQGLLHEPVAIFLTIMAVILIAPMFSERVRLPGIVGLIVGGIAIGPYGFNLLSNGLVMELLATIGLIYLMFNAGLEIDLGQFNRVRSKAIIFGVLTFAIPLVAGTAFGRYLGFTWPGAILLGSALSSHTLIALPILTRLGVMNNETVSVTVGATVFTDVSAFLVLAIITGMQQGGASAGRIALLVVELVAFAGLILFGLPRIGKFFFRRLSGHSIEFQFVLVALFVTAMLAETIGVHPVVGAFLAGLAINSAVPRHSQVVGRVLFVGEALFIPCFLLYSGMITDPAAFVQSREVLIVGIGLTAIAYLAKFVAAWLTARIFHYSGNEMWTMFGLSQCQAAVTLPTVLLGVEAGLFPQSVFSGTMLMILATSITSPLFVQRFGKKVKIPEAVVRTGKLFERVLVPVTDPQAQEDMVTLAGILAGAQEGLVLPCNVALATQHEVVGLSEQRRLMDAEVFKATDLNIHPISRVDTSVARGILHAAVENDATSIMLGWRGKPLYAGSVFGTVLDEVLWRARIPVLVTRLTESIMALEQVVMVITPGSTAVDFIDEMADAAITIADSVNVPLLVLTDSQLYERVCEELKRLNVEHPHEVLNLGSNVLDEVKNRVGPQHLVLLSTTGTRQRFQSSLGHIPEDLAAQTKASLAIIHYPT